MKIIWLKTLSQYCCLKDTIAVKRINNKVYLKNGEILEYYTLNICND